MVVVDELLRVCTCVFALYSLKVSLEFGMGLRFLWRDPVSVLACFIFYSTHYISVFF